MSSGISHSARNAASEAVWIVNPANGGKISAYLLAAPDAPERTEQKAIALADSLKSAGFELSGGPEGFKFYPAEMGGKPARLYEVPIRNFEPRNLANTDPRDVARQNLLSVFQERFAHPLGIQLHTPERAGIDHNVEDDWKGYVSEVAKRAETKSAACGRA